MADFRIFTESKADIKFLKDYIEGVFITQLNDEDFDTLGGRTGYKANGELRATIKKNNDNLKVTILIVDADNDFKKNAEEIIADFQNYNIPVSLFLFPNNQLNGNIEDMLAQIATDKKLINCFQEYEKCVAIYPKKLNDARIYSYLDMLLLNEYKDASGRDLRKEEYRNYKNTNHWKLDDEFLNPLKNFLIPFLQK